MSIYEFAIAILCYLVFDKLLDIIINKIKIKIETKKSKQHLDRMQGHWHSMTGFTDGTNGTPRVGDSTHVCFHDTKYYSTGDSVSGEGK